MRTEFEFVLPRGYVDETGAVHRTGTMRLATARDELEPLRDPTISGPDDPRLTILVLARVVRTLGTMNLVTPHEIEGLFAADLAYLQDFYGVVNFGTDADIDALLEAQRSSLAPRAQTAPAAPAEAPPAPAAPAAPEVSAAAERPITDLEERPVNRRAAIQEVPSSGR
ncbi:MAG TPA: hypothetical protein VFP61_03015 [Acidimicrobiales bacterium]|nr:hypothetical protein [Acidimicrobiales bacterium]